MMNEIQEGAKHTSLMCAEYGAVDIVGEFHLSFVPHYATPDGSVQDFFGFPEVS
jgi:hypothetical protein